MRDDFERGRTVVDRVLYCRNRLRAGLFPRRSERGVELLYLLELILSDHAFPEDCMLKTMERLRDSL